MSEAMFEKIGKAITSTGAVIFAMLMVIGAMIFFSHTLFSQALPATMEHWEKAAASWFLAFGWEFTVLITTVNVKHINSKLPVVMAAASGVILLFFIEAFDDSQPILLISQRLFVGMLVAAINFIYADLFYRKWQEYLDQKELPTKLNELDSCVKQLQRQLIEAQSINAEVNDLRSFKKRIDRELTCPHCGKHQDSFGRLHAHKGHCASNPRHLKTA